MNDNIDEDHDFLVNKDNKFDFNDLVEKIGYQSMHNKIIISCFLLILLEGSSFTFTATYIIALEKYFMTDDFMISILSSIIFVGVGLGSFSIGLLEPYFSRLVLIKYNFLSFIVFSLMLIFCSNIYVFCLVRLLIGYNIGVFIPIMLNILYEFLPIKFRTFWSLFVWTGFQIGQILNSFIALILMKNYESEMVPYVTFVLAIIYIIVGIPCFFLISDTYRNLIVKNKEEEGLIILRKLLKNIDIDMTEDLKIQIVKSIKLADNKEFKSEFKSLFSSNHIYITLISTFIFAITSSLFYGPALIYSKTLKDLNVTTSENIIISAIVAAIVSIFNTGIVSIICEYDIMGFKNISLILYSISLFLALSIIIWTNQIQYLLITFFAITTPAFNAITTEISLTFPTIIRDLALGYLYSCLRIGAFISQFIFLGTYQIGIKVPYIILCVLIATNLVLIFLIKTDTTKLPLDNVFEIENKHENENEHHDHEYEKSLNKTN